LNTIQCESLDIKNFHWFGTFTDLFHCEGPSIGNNPVIFYRDQLQAFFGTPEISFSVVACEKRSLIIDEAEYHSYTAEALLPLDGDTAVFAAPAATGDIPLDQIRAFYVPCGTLIVFKAGVWHKAPFPLNKDRVNSLIALPYRAYANDCTVAKIPGEKQVLIKV
jgi:ureidoglycolate hydrolase